MTESIDPRTRPERACKGFPTEFFYPSTEAGRKEAKSVCRECPIIDECLTFALERSGKCEDGRYGVWGGTTERERRKLARKRANDVQPLPIPA